MSKFLAFLPFLRRRTRMQRAGDFFSNRIGAKRAGFGGGGLLAALAVPYIIRKVRARRAENEFRPASA